MSQRAALIFSVLSLVLVRAGPCHALSLRSSAAEIFLGDVRPGKIAVVGESGPLSVENTGSEKAVIELSVANPSPDRLKDGFDALPDIVKRVDVKGASLTLEPGAKTELDLKVAIPERLEGGQYQFECLLQGRNPGGSVLTMRTQVTLAVGEGDPKDVPKEHAGSGFSVSPAKARLESAPIGAKTPARLKLVNAGESELVVRMTSMRALDESVSLEDGYAPAPNPHWLKAGPALRVKPGEVKEASFTLEIPRDGNLRQQFLQLGGGFLTRIPRQFLALHQRLQCDGGL